MMKMKKILLNVAFILAATLLGGCDDFFNPDTDVTLDNEDYISEESEMYSGYIGIMTKMQAIGDKVIYLNELRGEWWCRLQRHPLNSITCIIMMMI